MLIMNSVSLYGLNRLIGSIVCSCITYKTSTWVGNTSWQTPLAIMFAVPSVCLCFAWWVPESPRWLLRKGRDHQALKVLRKLYGTSEHQDLEMELVLLKQSLECEQETGCWADLFRRTNRVTLSPTATPSEN
jgi:MFS transporter, SP family, sugar:H+ symporter